MPVIGSSICLIENGRLFYRGKDAIRLSEEATLEDIATLLWRAEDGAELDADRPDAFPGGISASGLIERCQISLATVADEDLPAVDLTRTGVIRTGRRISTLAASVAPPAAAARTRSPPARRGLEIGSRRGPKFCAAALS